MNKPLLRAIEFVGSQRKLARLIGKEQPDISKWLYRDKHGVPPQMCGLIEVATGHRVKRRELRPDVFDESDDHPFVIVDVVRNKPQQRKRTEKMSRPISALSLEALLRELMTAQRDVDELTNELKRRTDGRKRRTGPRKPKATEDTEASS